MTDYQVLARRYRPQLFRDVVGQDSTVRTLKNAIKMKKAGQAYLFCGRQGTGKTTLARLLAKALNCLSLQEDCEPCNQCASCQEITRGYAMDVLEIDGASNRGIEDIRRINENAGFIPTTGKYKIYLIDEVHMLTKEAFNALLRTLEEPPQAVKFLFATTEPHRIPSTILSRCQHFHLNGIPTEQIQKKLSAIASDLKRKADPEALHLIARLSNGGLRDAESKFEQVITFCEEEIKVEDVTEILGLLPQEIFFTLHEAGLRKQFRTAFEIAQQVHASGKNIAYFLEDLSEHFRTLFLLKTESIPREAPRLAERTLADSDDKYRQAASYYQSTQLLDILEILYETQQTIKSATSERIALEILLLRIMRTHHRISIDHLVEKLQALEKSIELKISQQNPDSADLKMAPSQKQAISRGEEVEKPAHEPPIHLQSRYDTIMRFASKEFDGSLNQY